MGGDSWRARKDKIKAAYLEKWSRPVEDELAEIRQDVTSLETRASMATSDPATPPAPTGSVPSAAAPEVGLSAPRDEGLPLRDFIATSVMATATAEISNDRLTSGTSATSTSPASNGATVWQVTPLGFIEHNLSTSIVEPSSDRLLPGLPSRVHASLLRLATGRNEPVTAVIQAIAEFYVEQEDERAEGPLVDALVHYVDNMLA